MHNTLTRARAAKHARAFIQSILDYAAELGGASPPEKNIGGRSLPCPPSTATPEYVDMHIILALVAAEPRRL